MTFSWPSFLAAVTRASIPPKSSAEVAVLASVAPLELLLSLPESDGGEHADTAAAALSATRVTSDVRILTRPPKYWRCPWPGHASTVRADGPLRQTRTGGDSRRGGGYSRPRDRGPIRCRVPLLRPAPDRARRDAVPAGDHRGRVDVRGRGRRAEPDLPAGRPRGDPAAHRRGDARHRALPAARPPRPAAPDHRRPRGVGQRPVRRARPAQERQHLRRRR